MASDVTPKRSLGGKLRPPPNLQVKVKVRFNGGLGCRFISDLLEVITEANYLRLKKNDWPPI